MVEFFGMAAWDSVTINRKLTAFAHSSFCKVEAEIWKVTELARRHHTKFCLMFKSSTLTWSLATESMKKRDLLGLL